MNKDRFQISAGALLAAALIYYVSDGRFLLALIPPLMFHELGHVAALRLLGMRIRGFRMELRGFCIDYSGSAGPWGNALAAAAGPAAGLVYAILAARHGETAQLSAGISLLLSLFNLLPARPLDGGRIAAELIDERFSRPLSMMTAALVFLFGLWLFRRGKGSGLALAGLFLLLAQWEE